MHFPPFFFTSVCPSQTYRKDGEHRLSRPEDLELFCRLLDDLVRSNT